jgi:hypothetical protein
VQQSTKVELSLNLKTARHYRPVTSVRPC